MPANSSSTSPPTWIVPVSISNDIFSLCTAFASVGRNSCDAFVVSIVENCGFFQKKIFHCFELNFHVHFLLEFYFDFMSSFRFSQITFFDHTILYGDVKIDRAHSSDAS
jgi:hypothetical protein